MFKPTIWTAAFAAAVLTGQFQPPVATITTPESFTLSGVSVTVAGVSSWPLTIGDEVKLGNAPAVIRFPDKTQIAIEKGSTIRLERANDRTVVRLTSGAMRYRLGANGRTEVFAGSEHLREKENGVAVEPEGVKKSHKIGPPFDPPGPPPGKPPHRSISE